MLSEVAATVTAVDISTPMLEQLRQRASKQGIANIETVTGEIEDLPLPDKSHDVAVMSQALHHAESPAKALSEARRVLVPGGRLLVIDLLAHNEEWVRSDLQHRHLGFTEEGLQELLTRAGFQDVRLQRAARDPQPPHFMTRSPAGRARSHEAPDDSRVRAAREALATRVLVLDGP
jgi:ArsR family transcriptional regulator